MQGGRLGPGPRLMREEQGLLWTGSQTPAPAVQASFAEARGESKQVAFCFNQAWVCDTSHWLWKRSLILSWKGQILTDLSENIKIASCVTTYHLNTDHLTVSWGPPNESQTSDPRRE